MSAVPLVVGVDLGTRRFGLGAVRVDTGAPVDCWWAGIDEPGGGWRHQQIRRAFEAVCPRGVPAVVCMEDPTFASRGPSQAKQWGELIGLATAACRDVWGVRCEVWLMPVPEWKREAGVRTAPHQPKLPAKERRAVNLGYIVDRAVELGFDPGGDVDAAAGACIAHGARAYMARKAVAS